MSEPTLEQAVLGAIDARIAGIWTSIPGKIVGWDSTTQRASVEATVLDKGRLPTLSDVPVQFPCSGGFSVVLPVSVGTPGLIMCTAVAAGAWFRAGDVREPQDKRRHALSSAVFLPGFDPSAVVGFPSNAVVLGATGSVAAAVPVAKGPSVDSFISSVDNLIRTCTPGPNEPGLSAIKLAWTTLYPSPPLSVGTADVKVTG